MKNKKQYTIYETRTYLSKLLKRVERGEEIIIANGNRVVAKLIPAQAEVLKRIPGSAKGSFVMSDDFDAPLPEDISKFFQ
jgi:prevent-host-death family protein